MRVSESILWLALAATLVTGCATVEPDPCARNYVGGGSILVIMDFILEIPFQVRVIDWDTNAPVVDALVTKGAYGVEPSYEPEDVLGRANSEGLVEGVGITLTGNRNPYTPCNRERFSGIPVVVRCPGYTPYMFSIGLPESQGATINMGTVYLKLIRE